MNANDIYSNILLGIEQLREKKISYVSGRNDVVVQALDREKGTVTFLLSGKHSTAPCSMIEAISAEFSKGNTVNVEALFRATGNRRSAVEAIIANTPNVGYLKANSPFNKGPKSLCWFSKPIHKVGELREATELLEAEKSYSEFFGDIAFGETASVFYRLCNTEDVSLHFSRSVCDSMISAIVTKRFLIFTGLSGSGKTKVAQAFTKWIGHDSSASQVVPVGADWTSREQMLGYPDGIHPEKYVKQAALNLILEARKPENEKKPYFLILDEMNLSHVERYFSDFLSAIESDEAIPMHEVEGGLDGVPHRLELPKNLFVIGTVNVDETTYMFSPKVLDRANVIEFRVAEEDFDAFLKSPKKIDLDALCEKDAEGQSTGVGLGKDYGALLVDAAKQDVTPTELADEHDDLRRELGVLFRIFQNYNWEFGYRVGKEVSRFVYFHRQLSGDDWKFEDALDAQIVQKLMPKMNGSEDRLRTILMALAWYSSGLIEIPEKDEDEEPKDYYSRISDLVVKAVTEKPTETPDKLLKELEKQREALTGEQREEFEKAKPRYPMAFDKTLRMWKAVRLNGFTSFAEN